MLVLHEQWDLVEQAVGYWCSLAAGYCRLVRNLLEPGIQILLESVSVVGCQVSPGSPNTGRSTARDWFWYCIPPSSGIKSKVQVVATDHSHTNFQKQKLSSNVLVSFPDCTFQVPLIFPSNSGLSYPECERCSALQLIQTWQCCFAH